MSGASTTLAVRERSITLFLICLISAGLLSFFKRWDGRKARLHGQGDDHRHRTARAPARAKCRTRWPKRSKSACAGTAETYTTPGGVYHPDPARQHAARRVQAEFYRARKKAGDEAANLPSGVIGPMINDEYADVTLPCLRSRRGARPQRLLVREAEALRQRLLHPDAGREKGQYHRRAGRTHPVEFSWERTGRRAPLRHTRRECATPAGSVQTRGRGVHRRARRAAKDPTLALSDIATVRRGHETRPAS